LQKESRIKPILTLKTWGDFVSKFLERDRIILHFENLIKEIRDIVSAKIMTDADGKISEIYVISKSDKSPMQIVKEIESTLATFLVSQTDCKKDTVFHIPNLSIQGISTYKTQPNLEVKVLLKNSDGTIFEGKAKGTVSFQSRVSTTAYATINAIQLFVGENFVIDLEDVHTYKIGNNQAISVLVSVLTEEKYEQHLGCAIVEHDIYEAVAQAVLDAIFSNQHNLIC